MYDKCSDCEYAIIDNLKAENEYLQQRNKELESKLDKIEKIASAMKNFEILIGGRNTSNIVNILSIIKE